MDDTTALSDELVALAHAPEGAGNATRMLAIASALEATGQRIAVAGGGPGARFFRLNGIEQYEPESLDFIGQREASVVEALADTAPRAARRLREFFAWLRAVEPAVLLTDDPFAAVAATIRRVPFFRIDHSTAADFDGAVEQLGFRLFNEYSKHIGEGFFYTSLWSEHAPSGVIPVGPIVYEPADTTAVDPFDVLVIPGTYSTGFDDLVTRLRASGRTVRLVGGPDWEPVPAMYPYAAAADVVVCTGFSSIAEAAVAGTPCVVYPFIDCQRGIADRIEQYGVQGISIVHSIDEAFEAVVSPPEPSPVANGTDAVVEYLLDWMTTRRRYRTSVELGREVGE